MAFRHLFGERQLEVVAYCAEEVRRQRDTQLHVSYMVQAWEHAWTQARGRGRGVSPDLIQEIGALVSPAHNQHGFRRVGVRVGYSVKMDWQQVPRAIEMLCDAWGDGRIVGFHHALAGDVGPAEQFYYLFEDIHPFSDGNGRTGKILYNMLRGSLDDPIFPPDFYGGVANP